MIIINKINIDNIVREVDIKEILWDIIIIEETIIKRIGHLIKISQILWIEVVTQESLVLQESKIKKGKIKNLCHNLLVIALKNMLKEKMTCIKRIKNMKINLGIIKILFNRINTIAMKIDISKEEIKDNIMKKDIRINTTLNIIIIMNRISIPDQDHNLDQTKNRIIYQNRIEWLIIL